ncbi:CHAT domain-containing protein/tetratricopeptide (TPR) repeat protein [Algoriphagus sp. 4150]|uniref:CHAT domain-containing protein n=1 Tax=Algoriphagus sp. 4150 TaxID=2817756 RepID=UPI00285723FB|nr:CHAT domain-containing tetratricopeptide repeat protein [Algoriphagus sp. 4150]MDR7128983.1 CHAT domain-containing protein/tetratricopeptide (TPR) repeat protein [Algoriphagus sp. 4150]
MKIIYLKYLALFFILVCSTTLASHSQSLDSTEYKSKIAQLESIKTESITIPKSEIKNRVLLKELERYFKNEELYDNYLETLLHLSYSHYFEANMDSTLYYLEKGLSEIIRPKKSDKLETINIFFNRYASFLNDDGQYKKSKDLYQEQLEHLRKNDPSGLARAYNNFAVLLNNLKESEQSLRYYDSCLTILKQQGLDEGTPLAFTTYLNQSMPKINIGQYQEALESLKKSELNLIKMGRDKSPGDVILTSLYYAYVYSHKNEYSDDLEHAFTYANKGYQMLYEINKENFYMTYFYLVLADIEEKRGNFKESLDYNKKAVALKAKLSGEVNDDMPAMLTNVARVNNKLDYKDSAEYYFNQIKKIYDEPTQNKTYDYIEYLFEKADYYLKSKRFPEAENVLLEALKGFIPAYNWNRRIADNPPFELIPDVYQSAFFFIKKAEITQEIAEKNEDFDLLKSSLDSYIIGIILLNKSKSAIFNLRSKAQYGQQKSIYYSEAIQLANKLFQETDDKSYWEKAFILSDLDKSSNLKNHLNQQSTAYHSTIPKYLLVKELELKSEINLLEQEAYRDSFSKAIQSSSNDSTLSLIVSKKEEMNRLLSQYKQEYPNYYAMQYGGLDFLQEDILAGDQIKELRGSNKLILQYHELDDKFLLAYVKGKKQGILDIYKDEVFTRNLEEFIWNTKTPSSVDFQNSAHYLYQNLLAPVLELLPSKQIIIIPDGTLSYINFELLISDPIAEKANYKEFNYLLKSHTITYHYSSSLIKFKPTNLNGKSSIFMGFAPYQNITDPKHIAQYERTATFDFASYSPLPYSDREVGEISEKFSGKGYYGLEAKESLLKSEGIQSNILHFATHSYIDAKNPIFSGLLLSADDENDGILYTHELFDLKLNADLATLSACNSGSGEFQKGEGAISLARGFMYANVPNVLMSLWAVSDQSTSKLMALFYDNIYNGEQYSEAIRNAKLDYLASADHNLAHPYYWGAFIYAGDVEGERNTNFYYFLIAGIFIVGIYILYRRFMT